MITREQDWAKYAYICVGKVAEGKRDDYDIAINDLGANIIRLGLAGAMSALERRDVGGLREHLQAAPHTIWSSGAGDLPTRVRALHLPSYIVATREMLHLTAWFKRATQAT